jgi:HlyD family secretion protein
MLVYAKTDESDVGNIKLGKPVTFKVDAFPKDTFHGRVSQVRMNATTVQNVVTYDTIIEFDNPELKLFPGMTAYVTIPVATAQNVIKLPNTALRYKPPMTPEEVLAIYKQYGIEVDQRQSVGADSLAERSLLQGGGMGNLPRKAKADSAVVWKLQSDSRMEPVKVSIGITDHSYTEVTSLLKGELKEGDEVVIRSTVSKTPTPGGIRR